MVYKRAEYDPELLLALNRVVFQSYNQLYNFMAGELTPFMTSISILDYIEVMDHPEIKAANTYVQETEHISGSDIQNTYDVIEDVLNREGVLEDNSLRRAYKHKIVPIAQIWQDVGPRGFVNDIDQHIISKPIRTGYAEGIRELPDFIAESRTGSLAKIMTGDPMAASEYQEPIITIVGIAG